MCTWPRRVASYNLFSHCKLFYFMLQTAFSITRKSYRHVNQRQNYSVVRCGMNSISIFTEICNSNMMHR